MDYLANATIKSKNDGRMEYGQIDRVETWQWANKPNLWRSKRNVESMEIPPFLQWCNLGDWHDITNQALFGKLCQQEEEPQSDGMIGGIRARICLTWPLQWRLSTKIKCKNGWSTGSTHGCGSTLLSMLRRPYNESVGSNNFSKTHDNLDATVGFICQHQKRC